MVVRRRAWLTREGWYYLALLAFVLGGAVIRSGNLLLILAGMMIGPLIFNWRLVIAGLTSLIIRRQLPPSVVAGEPLTVEFRVENTKWWLSTWLLRIEDRIERVEGEIQNSARYDKPLSAAALIPHIPASGSATGTYRVALHRRGRYRFGPLRCGTRFPLGLVRGQIVLPDREEIIVAPHLGRLLPAWVNLIEAEQLGDERRHPQRGISEGDYYGLRPWQSGDSLRWIHWRTTAKLGRPIVRQFERRTSPDVAIILDPWLPPNSSQDDEALAELAISFAATALYDISTRGHARLTLAICSRQPECLSGPASPPFCQELLTRLACVPLTREKTLSAALNQAIETAPRGSRLVIISPRSPTDPSLSESTMEIDIDPDDLAWIDVGSEQLASLFTLES
ncbi:MAG TPA: DUF58 domain-containing protein [Pirellulaceae bacterium]|jgi:uncharacterized protein (DUF58 family)